jgi:hypothetical protein
MTATNRKKNTIKIGVTEILQIAKVAGPVDTRSTVMKNTVNEIPWNT